METIRVTYSSIDRCRKTRTFKTLKGAQKFAQEYVGQTPEVGGWYAVSGDGVGKIECRGCSLIALFPQVGGLFE
jgi:hypothetical protein